MIKIPNVNQSLSNTVKSEVAVLACDTSYCTSAQAVHAIRATEL